MLMATRSLACVLPFHRAQQFWHSTAFQERQLTVRDQVNCKLTCSSSPPQAFVHWLQQHSAIRSRDCDVQRSVHKVVAMKF
jgi:hypothetical protein